MADTNEERNQTARRDYLDDPWACYEDDESFCGSDADTEEECCCCCC